MNNDDEKDYNNLPSFAIGTDPVEEGDVLHEEADNDTKPMGAAQNLNSIPDSPLVDGNAQEANKAIEDTAEES